MCEQIINSIKNKNLGVIGKPSDWLISSIPLYKDIKDKFGINLIDIDLNEFYLNYKEFNLFNFDYDKKELDKASGVDYSISKLIDKYHLDGFTIRCFDLLNVIKTTGCLSLALKNKEGIIGCCEGDIMAMISMLLVKELTNKSCFQANPSKIDVNKKEIIFSHCTVPLDMISDIKIMTHFESNIGCAIRGKLKKENVTIFRISSDLKRYFCIEGKIVSNLEDPNMCRTQIKIKTKEDISILLKNPCGNHHIIFYGNYKKNIESLMKLYGINN